MTSHRFRFTVGLITLALAALACSVPGLDSGSSNPVQSGGGGGAAPADSGGSGDTLQYNGLDFGSLTSYHAAFTFKWSGTNASGAASSGQMTMDQVGQTTPPASHITMTSNSSDASANIQNFEMYTIGDTSYMLISAAGKSMCVSSPSTTGSSGGTSVNPDNWLGGSDLSKAQRILPDEVANGINARHFRMTQAETTTLSGLANYTLDVWMAVDGNYPVKMTMVGDGTLQTGGTGHTEWNWDLLEVNIPVTITPPDNCQSGADSGLPTMPDASGLSNVGGMTIYITPSALADVVAFYNAQMPAAGWTLSNSQDAGAMSMLEFTKDGQTATITMTTAANGTQVMIQLK